jgi:lipid-A-disaccharide synthase
MKYYIISGEASGDLHGSNLIKELKLLDTNATIRCWGGDLMVAKGATLVKHYRELAFMGFKEVIVNLKTILANIQLCKDDVLNFKPDVLILIDYPGFNLRIAEFAHLHGIKTIYYISPQVWAWKSSRIKGIKKNVDEMICILPFEVDFYKKWDYKVHYVGHPLLDAIDTFKAQLTSHEQEVAQKPIIALLPGSRKQEISKMLPTMLTLTQNYPDYQFTIAGAPGQSASFYEKYIHNYPNVNIVFGATYSLLLKAHAALVTSGTATLETALFKVPQVVCYKGSNFSYQIGKRLVDIKYISLVNLILDEPAVEELIQNDFNLNNLSRAFEQLLGGGAREELLKKYDTLIAQLGHSGASAKAAKIIFNVL